ncbi:MAG: insulinase family protein [Candidatus Marinimicrobia bacterium]|nr:insulinase family protein [Candidatus Neomarinimicrobiota bacterium]MBT3675769.1 insulinase family protein [Candidatus Neomarinimicrobiota bacterium]MBT4067949.1 insulinase family protein [Candidatus Neomarinimicrobiota bacterium]MBT4308280.1 insulinase family protein [Candidatus Neomarinimicrobiota bacterium]MBT5176128.1 insulinase family protein [Candidatus Neomarinimicrobiota bacterium]
MGFFKKQVKTNTELDGLRTFVMPTGVKEVITFAGSFLGGSIFSPGKNRKIAPLTAAMIDKGTLEKDKYAISDILESVGAELTFSSTRHHAQFSGHCLKDDLDIVIQLLVEQLRTPVFSEEELTTLKTRMIGNLERSKEDTKQQAMIRLLRIMYPKNHPNYQLTTNETIEQVSSANIKEVEKFHQNYYGLGSLNFAAVGDVKPVQINDLLGKYLNGWKTKNTTHVLPGMKADAPKESNTEIHIPEKTSMDIYLGQAIGIDRDHKDYYPLMMAVYILGGNFSARLMQTVRDQQGLTYGIGSSLAGVSFGGDGYWSTWGTFAPDLLDAGRKATIEQILNWYKNGVTQDELEAKKTTIAGAYQVGMDSTGGLMAQILSNAEKNRSVEYLDQYPDLISRITLDQTNKAIRTYVDPDKLTVVAAGTFKDS